MKPQLGDTISNRYVLVSPLREETGLQVWKASDHVLARDCQLFIVSSSKALQEVNATASMLAISHDSHFTKVLQLQHAGQVALVVTQLDEGMTLSEYLALNANQPLSYTAMRSIIGEVIESLHALQKNNLTHFSISTDTVRLTRSGIQIADAPVSIMLADTSRAQALENREQLAIRQISALLYAMLIRRPSTLSTDFRLEALAPTTPMEFRVICKRGLELEEDDGFPTVPMATIAELEALLGEYQPLSSLGSMDITLPSMDSECSIANVPLLQILEKDVLPLPDTLAAAGSIPEMTFTAPEPHNDFSDGKEALAKSVAATSGAVKSLWSSGRELLSEEDIDGVTDTSDSPFSFPTRVSVPADGMSSDDSQLEKTGRIPVIGADGQVIQPGEESARALKAEQEAIDAAYTAGRAAVPPSFTPKNPSSASANTDVADAKLFGKLKTKVVAIIVAVIVVAVALGFAVHGLMQPSDSVTTDSKGPWPEINLDEVPFGEGDQSDANSADSSNSDTSGNTDSSNSKDSSDASANTPASGESTASKQPKKTEDKVVTADKQSKKVPDPKQPENTTAYEIDNRQFLSNPDGQQGYGYYVHLSQPQKAYRMVIKIRSSGGQGYIRVNATNSPSQGEQVAQFEFDASGTTDIKFDKAVETQDIMLWVPLDSLPGNQLYIESIQVF